MKIRLSYVSNSSNSSFIIGIGVLKEGADYQLLDIIKECDPYYDYEIVYGEDKPISIKSFTESEVKLTLEKGKKAIIFRDSAEVEENEYGEIISDPDLSDFSDTNKIIFNHEDLFEKINYDIGQGYDG